MLTKVPIAAWPEFDRGFRRHQCCSSAMSAWVHKGVEDMKRLTVLVMTLASILVAGCGGGNDSTTMPVAVVGPMTGQYASFGAQMRNGAEMAVEDINAAGGLL